MSQLPVNHFKRALAEGRAQIGLWCSLPDPYIAEIVAGAGYDWLLFDTEHAPTDVPRMLQQLQGAGVMPGATASFSAAGSYVAVQVDGFDEGLELPNEVAVHIFVGV